MEIDLLLKFRNRLSGHEQVTSQELKECLSTFDSLGDQTPGTLVKPLFWNPRNVDNGVVTLLSGSQRVVGSREVASLDKNGPEIVMVTLSKPDGQNAAPGSLDQRVIPGNKRLSRTFKIIDR